MTNPLAFSPPGSRESCGDRGDGGRVTGDRIGDGQQPLEGTAPWSTTEHGIYPAATQQAAVEAGTFTTSTRSPVAQSDEGHQPGGSDGGNGSGGCNNSGSSGGSSGGSRSGRSGGGSRQSARSNKASPRGSSANSVHNDPPLSPSSENTTSNRKQRLSACPPSSSSGKSQQDGSRGVTVGDDWCAGGKSSDGVTVSENKTKRPGGISDAAAQRQRQAAARYDERRTKLTRQWTKALGALCSPAHKDLWPSMIDAGILGALYKCVRRRSISIYIYLYTYIHERVYTWCLHLAVIVYTERAMELNFSCIARLVVLSEFSCCVTAKPVFHDRDN